MSTDSIWLLSMKHYLGTTSRHQIGNVHAGLRTLLSSSNSTRNNPTAATAAAAATTTPTATATNGSYWINSAWGSPYAWGYARTWAYGRATISQWFRWPTDASNGYGTYDSNAHESQHGSWSTCDESSGESIPSFQLYFAFSDTLAAEPM